MRPPLQQPRRPARQDESDLLPRRPRRARGRAERVERGAGTPVEAAHAPGRLDAGRRLGERAAHPALVVVPARDAADVHGARLDPPPQQGAGHGSEDGIDPVLQQRGQRRLGRRGGRRQVRCSRAASRSRKRRRGLGRAVPCQNVGRRRSSRRQGRGRIPQLRRVVLVRRLEPPRRTQQPPSGPDGQHRGSAGGEPRSSPDPGSAGRHRAGLARRQALGAAARNRGIDRVEFCPARPWHPRLRPPELRVQSLRELGGRLEALLRTLRQRLDDYRLQPRRNGRGSGLQGARRARRAGQAREGVSAPRLLRPRRFCPTSGSRMGRP